MPYNIRQIERDHSRCFSRSGEYRPSSGANRLVHNVIPSEQAARGDDVLRSVVSIAGLVVATTSVAGKEETLCQTAGLVVMGETPEVRDRICQIADREIPKLAMCNVAVPEGVTIKFENTLFDGCVGVFHCDKALISLLPPDIMAKHRALDLAFADVQDESCFDSVVVHELTHAAYDTVECPFTTMCQKPSLIKST